MASELMIPNIVEAKYTTERQARVVLEPMERGFGHTLGNALRRVLLSSIRGTAITEAEITGVKHEYDTIDGVQEDVVDILLNLKGVAVRMHERAEAELHLKKSGPGPVCASDIELGHDVEIANPDHVIAHLTETGKLEIRIKIETGCGYVPAPTSHSDSENSKQIGRLLLDASFSPIRKVSYHVENTRVEQRTDLDKLVLELTTNGTVHPKQVLQQAASILTHQLSVLQGLDEEISRPAMTVRTEVDPIFKMSIDELSLSVRSTNSLKQENIFFIGDLVQMNEDELMKQTPNIGVKTVAEIKQALGTKNLILGTKIENWPPGDLARFTRSTPIF